MRFLNSPPCQGLPGDGPLTVEPPSRVVQKGWGAEYWLTNFPEYCFKILHFVAGKRFSFHYHSKVETWYVQSGRFTLKVGSRSGKTEIFALEPGDVYHVDSLIPHQITCIEEGDIFEASSQHFEDDSIRIEKGD